MMQASAYGRIGQDPKNIPTQSGKSMAAASIAVAIGENHDDPPQWMGILAFGRVAEELLRHSKGDLISVSGRVQRSSWTGGNGEKREQLQIVADSVISARTARPNTSKRNPNNYDSRPHDRHDGDMDDHAQH